MTQTSYLWPIDEQIKEPVGNRTLVQYGINEEKSDFRAHVTGIQKAYVFPRSPTARLVAQADRHGLVLKTVRISDIKTARGYPVPLSYIEGLQEIAIPLDTWQTYLIAKGMPTSTKGQLATAIMVVLLKKGLVSLPVQPDFADSKALQIAGTDIIISAALHMQVKCDLPGGDRKYGGTGNLFIQVEECNPYQWH